MTSSSDCKPPLPDGHNGENNEPSLEAVIQTRHRTSLARRALAVFATTSLTWILSTPLLRRLEPPSARLPLGVNATNAALALLCQLAVAATCMLLCYGAVIGRSGVNRGEVAFVGPQLVGAVVLWGLGWL